MSDGTGPATGLKILKGLVWIIYALATAAIIVLAFAFFLLLFDANTSTGFVHLVYTWGARFAQPFANIVTPTKLQGGGIIAWSFLFAIAVYALLALLLSSILNGISRRMYRKTHPRTVAKSDMTQTPQTAPAATPAAESAVTQPAPAPAAEPAVTQTAPAADQPQAPDGAGQNAQAE